MDATNVESPRTVDLLREALDAQARAYSLNEQEKEKARKIIDARKPINAPTMTCVAFGSDGFEPMVHIRALGKLIVLKIPGVRQLGRWIRDNVGLEDEPSNDAGREGGQDMTADEKTEGAPGRITELAIGCGQPGWTPETIVVLGCERSCAPEKASAAIKCLGCKWWRPEYNVIHGTIGLLIQSDGTLSTHVRCAHPAASPPGRNAQSRDCGADHLALALERVTSANGILFRNGWPSGCHMSLLQLAIDDIRSAMEKRAQEHPSTLNPEPVTLLKAVLPEAANRALGYLRAAWTMISRYAVIITEELAKDHRLTKAELVVLARLIQKAMEELDR